MAMDSITLPTVEAPEPEFKVSTIDKLVTRCVIMCHDLKGKPNDYDSFPEIKYITDKEVEERAALNLHPKDVDFYSTSEIGRPLEYFRGQGHQGYLVCFGVAPSDPNTAEYTM
ncbi:hypothetical protein PG994_013502 [Apiospora phragmitis]|uniref:Uncharacterized protein n=1 Tax=Apiospora phragmitis TaxID=2905665 RepID=A0ABR1T8S9_9PEZI